MSTPEPATVGDAGADRPIDSRAAFRAEVVAATRAAIARQARELWWIDPDFADWPLDDGVLHEALSAWLRAPHRRLRLLAHRYDAVERNHPRFVVWRSIWAHAIDPRIPDEGLQPELPTLIVDDGPTLLEVWRRDPWRGRRATDAAGARRARDAADAAMQRTQAAWPVRALGL